DNYVIAQCPRPARPALAAARPTSFAYDVLLVYSPDERDASWARSFLRRLEDRGVRVCTEELDAELGAMRISEIERLVSCSRYTLPVLTHRFSTGAFEELQVKMALHLGIEQRKARLIPIIREPSDVPDAVRLLVSLDLRGEDDVAPAVERLVKTLRRA